MLLNQTEQILLNLVKAALQGKEAGKRDIRYFNGHGEELYRLAENHAVTSLLYDPLSKSGEDKTVLGNLQKAAKIVARSNYRLLFLTKYITSLLAEHGILAVVLKGCATSSYYPVPELRKAGDVDVLIPREQEFQKACGILEQDGFYRLPEQDANHHIEFLNAEGISIELHCSLVEDFENKGMNRYLKRRLPEFAVSVEENTYWGFSFYQPQDAYHAYYLLLHMLQHFLRAGFGLKFLCDWTVFWKRRISTEQKKRFWRMARESRVDGFAQMITEICVRYLGLSRDRVAFMLHPRFKAGEVEEFTHEILSSGEFGRTDGARMVVLPGTGLWAYVREFHHQMHLNYPRAGRVVLLWPFLWSATLYRFLYNNRKLRKVHGSEILKEAGRRSRMISSLHLFERKK